MSLDQLRGETQIEEKMDADWGDTATAKEPLDPAGAGGGKEGFSPRPLERAWHLDFRLLAPGTVRR